MQNFVPIDYVFLGIIAVFAVVALIKGFIQEIFSKAAWVCAALGAFFFYTKLALVYHNQLKSMIFCEILAFLSIFIVVFIIVKLIGLLISKLCDFNVIRGLDRALGLFFGIIEGFAVVALIIFLLKTQNLFSTEQLLDRSFFYRLIEKFVQNPEIQEVISSQSKEINNILPETKPAT